jgi:hypothetical protein
MGTKWVRNSKISSLALMVLSPTRRPWNCPQKARSAGTSPRPAEPPLSWPFKCTSHREVTSARSQESGRQLPTPQKERTRRTAERSGYVASIPNYGTHHPLVQIKLTNWNRRPPPKLAQSPRSSQTSNSPERNDRREICPQKPQKGRRRNTKISHNRNAP